MFVVQGSSAVKSSLYDKFPLIGLNIFVNNVELMRKFKSLLKNEMRLAFLFSCL